VLQVGLLFSSAQALTAGCFVFLAAIIIALLCKSSGMFGLLLCDTLCLALLVGCSLSIGFGLSFGFLLGLLTLDFGILSGIPAV
jgi:hypothetical protein